MAINSIGMKGDGIEEKRSMRFLRRCNRINEIHAPCRANRTVWYHVREMSFRTRRKWNQETIRLLFVVQETDPRRYGNSLDEIRITGVLLPTLHGMRPQVKTNR
jgi:hypothetical protein